jgi:hypothetical protein
VIVRLVVVTVLALGLALARLALRTWRSNLQRQPPGERLPAELVGDGPRTWVLFSTPWCATCGPAERQLRAADPTATVVRIDATDRPDLVDTLRIRTAPTVLLAGPDGRVLRRLAGPDAVSAHVAGLAPA